MCIQKWVDLTAAGSLGANEESSLHLSLVEKEHANETCLNSWVLRGAGVKGLANEERRILQQTKEFVNNQLGDRSCC